MFQTHPHQIHDNQQLEFDRFITDVHASPVESLAGSMLSNRQTCQQPLKDVVLCMLPTARERGWIFPG